MIIQKLKEIRKYFGITQPQLAERIDSTHSIIRGIESGNQNMTIEFASKLCVTFNINLSWLIADKGPMFIPDYAANGDQAEIEHFIKTYGLTKEEAELLEYETTADLNEVLMDLEDAASEGNKKAVEKIKIILRELITQGKKPEWDSFENLPAPAPPTITVKVPKGFKVNIEYE